MYPRPVKEGKQLIEGRSLGAERLLHDSHTTMRNCAWEHRHRHDLSTSLHSTDSLAVPRAAGSMHIWLYLKKSDASRF
jgi:hypothetical protein